VDGQAFDKAILEHDVTPRYKFYVSLISQRNSATSFFGLSLRSLPRQYSTPFFWSPGDLDFLKGTALANSVRDITAALKSESELCLPLLYHGVPKLFSTSIQFQNYQWANSTHTSRGFPIELNTNDTNIILKHCGDTKIGANQQVFNKLWNKSNDEFLSRYSFCVENNFKYDTVMVVVRISSQGSFTSKENGYDAALWCYHSMLFERATLFYRITTNFANCRDG